MHCAAWRGRQTLSSSMTAIHNYQAQYLQTPFGYVLQAAAGRAWTRSSSSLSTDDARRRPTHHNTKPNAPSSSRSTKVRQRSKPKSWRPLLVTPFPPELVTDADATSDDPDRPENDADERNLYSTLVSPILYNPFATTTKLPRANTSHILKENMLRLIRRDSSKPTLNQLVHYHSLHHATRTTSTYNILIQLALRHTSYGIVQRLLDAMQADKLKHTQRTTTLRIRWLVATGYRGRAWKLAQSSATDGKSIPLPHVLEFFRHTKDKSNFRGAPTSTSAKQFLVLLEATGVRITHRTSPRIVTMVVKSLLLLDRPEDALRIAKSFLGGLPPKAPMLEAHMNMIHILIQYAPNCPSFHPTTTPTSTTIPKPLLVFRASLQVLHSILPLHKSIKPTSTTLMVLLGHLKGSRHCGRVAQDTVNEFKARWGSSIEDQEVKRRLVGLSLKQNRLKAAEDHLWPDKDEEWTGAEPVRGHGRGRRVLPKREDVKVATDEEHEWHGAYSDFASRRTLASSLPSDRRLFPRRGSRNIWWKETKLRYLRKVDEKRKRERRQVGGGAEVGDSEDGQNTEQDSKGLGDVPYAYTPQFHRKPVALL